MQPTTTARSKEECGAVTVELFLDALVVVVERATQKIRPDSPCLDPGGPNTNLPVGPTGPQQAHHHRFGAPFREFQQVESDEVYNHPLP